MPNHALSPATPIHGWSNNILLTTAMRKQAAGDELSSEETEELNKFALNFQQFCAVSWRAYGPDLAKTHDVMCERMGGFRTLGTRFDQDTMHVFFTFNHERFSLEVDLPPVVQEVSVMYNEPVGQAYMDHMARLHELCRANQISYTVNYQEGQNLWDGALHSCVDNEEYQTRDYSLSTVLELLIEHLEQLYP